MSVLAWWHVLLARLEPPTLQCKPSHCLKMEVWFQARDTLEFWIRTLTTGGNVAYKCMASNSVGVSSSDYINFMVEGETTEFFEWQHILVTDFN